MELVWEIARISGDLILGVCIKLFCDNGRIRWSDFVNDFLFWIPGVRREIGDGLTRQIEAMGLSSDNAVELVVARRLGEQDAAK